MRSTTIYIEGGVTRSENLELRLFESGPPNMAGVLFVLPFLSMITAILGDNFRMMYLSHRNHDREFAVSGIDMAVEDFQAAGHLTQHNFT